MDHLVCSDFIEVLVLANILDGVLKVGEDLSQRHRTHLVVQPLVVEENIVVEVFVSEAPHQLKRVAMLICFLTWKGSSVNFLRLYLRI